MQNKKSSEQVVARRLRPIYDSIDAAQYKKAIVEADKVLKKHPQTYTAKALKALALIRNDRSTDALPLLVALEKEVAAEQVEYDENTVQALCHCYKELNNPERIVALYTALVKRNPTNELLARELFFSHVRTKDFRQQQQVSMQLYKDTKINQYYCWTLMSVLMQGYVNEQMGISMFFPLAEKMLEKLPPTELHQIPGGVDLHLLVLELRKKFADAIQLIESNQMADSHSDEQIKHRLDNLYKLANRMDALRTRAMECIRNDPNELSNWKNLVETIQGEEEKSEEEKIRNIHQIVERLPGVIGATPSRAPQANNVTFAERRGPLLGQLLLIEKLLTSKMLTEQQIAATPLGTPLSALMALADIVYDKPFGFDDLSPFLHLLSPDSAKQLLDHVAAYPAQQQSVEHNKKIWPIILWEQLSFRFHPPANLSDEQLKTVIRRLTTKFATASDGGDPLTNEENNKKEEERKLLDGVPATAFAQLIVQHCWEFYVREGAKIDTLLWIIAFLEWVYGRYADCTASIPITLCRLYGIIGDVGKIEALEKQIQLKFIQRDSLAFLHFFVPYQFGNFKSANIYYTSLGAMYDTNEKEVNECLVSAYKNHAFAQIPKLVQFASRSSKSIFSVGAEILNRTVSGCFAVGTPELAAVAFIGDGEQIDWPNVADNRDFSVSKTPIVPCQNGPSIREYSFDEMKHYFTLKHSLNLAIGHIGTDQMETKAAAFFRTLEECRAKFGEPSKLERMLESYVNLQLHHLVAPKNKLFALPSLVINLAIDLGKTLKMMADGGDGQQQPAKCSASFSSLASSFPSHLEEIHAFYSGNNVAEVDGRVGALRSLSIALELLAMCLIGCKLMEKAATTMGAATVNQQKNGTMRGKGEKKGGEKQQQKHQHNPLIDQITGFIQLIGQSLRRMQAYICANFVPPVNGRKIIEDNGQQNEQLEKLCPDAIQREIAAQLTDHRVGVGQTRAVDELNDAIGHLLLNHCSVDLLQSLNIHQK